MGWGEPGWKHIGHKGSGEPGVHRAFQRKSKRHSEAVKAQ